MHLEIMLGLVGPCSGAYLCIEYCDLPLCMHEMFRMNPSFKDPKLFKSNQGSADMHHPTLTDFTPPCLENS